MVVEQDYLTNCPLDWLDFVMVTVNKQSRHKDDLSNLIVLNDEQSKTVFDFLANEQIELFVLGHPKNGDKFVIWQLLAVPNEKAERTFIGGENLREFCDCKNLYYRSMMTSDNKLISSSQLLYLKEDGEDCRIPEKVATSDHPQ